MVALVLPARGRKRTAFLLGRLHAVLEFEVPSVNGWFGLLENRRCDVCEGTVVLGALPRSEVTMGRPKLISVNLAVLESSQGET